jgi:cell division protein FtsZ
MKKTKKTKKTKRTKSKRRSKKARILKKIKPSRKTGKTKKAGKVKKVKIKKHSRKVKKVPISKPKMKSAKIIPVKLRMTEGKREKFFMPKIKVVGIGGGGGNAISRMFDYFPKGVDLIAINTDTQDLEYCHARKRLVIGRQTTKGMGAGMNPDLGRQAAEESKEEITKILSGADMVFLTSGFGGGTGSGATPIIAEIAQELGILTVAVVTQPFSFEGIQRIQIARDAIVKLKDRVDSYITISNDKIFSIINQDTSLHRAFEAIDEVLKNAVLGVVELIVSPGIINVDFADVKTIMQNSGAAIIGVGISSGKDRAVTAANMALNSPLLENIIDGAKGVLFSVSGHRDMKMSEINEIARMISENVDPSAKIIFGTYHDRKLARGQIKVTLIATGFGSAYGRNYSLFSDFESYSKGGSIFQSTSESKKTLPIVKKEEKKDASVSGNQASETIDNEEEVWDTPAFLRKKGKKR